MRLRDQWLIAREGMRAVGRMLGDAFDDRRGLALPLGPEELLDPEIGIEALLDPDEILGEPAEALPGPLSIAQQDAPSSNCCNSAIRVGEEPVPRLFVKQPARDLATRLFANLIGFWRIECTVCRNLSTAMPIDTPRVHAVRERGSRFLLVLENLALRPGIRLHVNRDFVAGIAPEDAGRCIDTLATLHAGFSGLSEAEREAALPRALDPFRSPGLRPIMAAVNRQAAAPCHRRAPELFTSDLERLYRRALARWDAMSDAWYAGRETLVHGDSHWGNFYRTDAGMGMLDFQGAHFGSGVRDVSYCLVNSMSESALARHERGLVERYARAVSDRGAPITFDEAWWLYRGFSFQTLMTAVVSIGLGSFTDSDAVMGVMLERSCAAVRRLDFEGWLEALD